MMRAVYASSSDPYVKSILLAMVSLTNDWRLVAYNTDIAHRTGFNQTTIGRKMPAVLKTGLVADRYPEYLWNVSLLVRRAERCPVFYHPPT